MICESQAKCINCQEDLKCYSNCSEYLYQKNENAQNNFSNINLKRLMNKEEINHLLENFEDYEIEVIKNIFKITQDLFDAIDIFQNKNYCYLDNNLVIGK